MIGMLLHRCEDGHSWRVHEDGTVAPSYAAAGTHLTWPGYDPATCPEPRRDRQGRYGCEGCGERFFSGHGTPGMMSDPWSFKDGCKPPDPACGKPPIQTFVWHEEKGKAGWVDVTPGQMTFDELDHQPGDATRVPVRS